MIKNYSRIYLILSIAFLSSITLNAQIVINEVSSATTNGYLDEDKSLQDWVEFYNTSSSPINMGGYKIESNENGNISSWTFPNVTIKAHDYLTVFCSGSSGRAADRLRRG